MLSFAMHSEQQYVSAHIRQVYLELTTSCNLSCSHCPRQYCSDLQEIHLSLSRLDMIVANLKELPALERIVLLGYGEALCHPHFPEIIQKLMALGKKVVLVTNGHLISTEVMTLFIDSALTELFISCDDLPHSNHLLRRGSNIEKLREILYEITTLKTIHKKYHPIISMEIVAQKQNLATLPQIAQYASAQQLSKVIITNLFPYCSEQEKNVLFQLHGPLQYRIPNYLPQMYGGTDLVLANQLAKRRRCCPFIEKGSVFITANGAISPCFELAYTHNASYFGAERTHHSLHFGSIESHSLISIWQSERFRDFRSKFQYFDFPDCSACHEPAMCSLRTDDVMDCCFNDSPCGECLWAKNIIICP